VTQQKYLVRNEGPPPPTPSQEGECIDEVGGDTPLPGSIGMLHLPPPLARRLKG
jgi:hypothetical protein